MTCEKCNASISSISASTRFCSRACANSRVHSSETKSKISTSLKGRSINSNTLKALRSNEVRAKAVASRVASLKLVRKLRESTQPFETWPGQWRYDYIVQRAKGVCEECHLAMRNEQGKGPYEVHHIDGNRKNNSENNLQHLCLLCHWKTDNYRFRNRSHRRIA